MRRPRSILVVLVAATLIAAGCSGEDSADPPEPGGITTPDGETLGATFELVEGSATTVVLAHMRGADRSTWDPIIDDLTSSGYSTLAFDFRGYGGSTGQRDTNLDVDLAAAVQSARSRGAARIVAVGASMGGTAVLEGSAGLRVDGAIAISAPGEFLGLDGYTGASLIGAPLLLIDTEGDTPYVDQLTAIQRDTDAELIVFDGSAHGTSIFATHDAEMTEVIVGFVDRVDRAGGAD